LLGISGDFPIFTVWFIKRPRLASSQRSEPAQIPRKFVYIASRKMLGQAMSIVKLGVTLICETSEEEVLSGNLK
jgi:hypothetical protein